MGSPLKDKSDQVTISSDASLLSWGAACVKNRTGSAWSVQEQTMHIYCLELLTAMLAAKTFLKDVSEVSVLLQLDNATEVAYFSNAGGTVSSQLTDLVKILWMWALNKDTILTAQHMPGVSNAIADVESQTVHDKSGWMLCPKVFWAIMEAFGPLDVDLFAYKLTHQISRFFSCRPDPLV